MDIQITERALQKIKDIAAKEGISLDDTYLRIAVVSGGCSGLTYDLGWDTTVQEKDRRMEVDGVKVLIDLKSFLYIAGSTLDFTEGLDGRGFHFLNPKAARTCACGESFSL